MTMPAAPASAIFKSVARPIALADSVMITTMFSSEICNIRSPTLLHLDVDDVTSLRWQRAAFAFLFEQELNSWLQLYTTSSRFDLHYQAQWLCGLEKKMQIDNFR